MATTNVYYFAYGSNLDPERMKERTGIIRPEQRAFLPGYRFAFNKRGTGGAIYANIVPCANSTVWGVLYSCSPEAVQKLDDYEGVAGGHYNQSTVTVHLDNGQHFNSVTYVAGLDFICKEGKPQSEYLEHILIGGRAHHLPEEYLLEVKQLAR